MLNEFVYINLLWFNISNILRDTYYGCVPVSLRASNRSARGGCLSSLLPTCSEVYDIVGATPRYKLINLSLHLYISKVVLCVVSDCIMASSDSGKLALIVIDGSNVAMK